MIKKVTFALIILIFAVTVYLYNPAEEWCSGNYSVSWVDNDLSLYLDIDEGNGIGRVMHKVIAVGEDATWIVVKRLNSDNPSEEYFYFSKSNDDRHKNAEEVVIGPLSSEEYSIVKSQLNLPDFSKHF